MRLLVGSAAGDSMKLCPAPKTMAGKCGGYGDRHV